MHVVSVVKQLREIQLGYLSGVQSGYQSGHGVVIPPKIQLNLENQLLKWHTHVNNELVQAFAKDLTPDLWVFPQTALVAS